MKKKLFTENDIEVVCPQKMVWDEMGIVGERERLCEGCDKVLVDVTGYTKEEVYALQKKDPTICVAVSNTLLVSSLALSLSACSSITVTPQKEESVVQEEVVKSSEKKDEVNLTNEKVTVVEINESLDLEEEVILEPTVGEEAPRVVVGLPARPDCSMGTVILNRIKEFFGMNKDYSCYE